MRGWRAYKAFFASALQAHLAYTQSVFLGLAANIVGFGIILLIWRYATRGSSQPEFFAYLVLAHTLNFMMNIFLERSVGERIREGLIAVDLLKPVDFQLLYLTQAATDTLFQGFVALFLWGLGLAALGPVMLPANAASLFFFFVSLLLAFLVQYGICFTLVQGIFATNSNYGIFASRVSLHQAFSGTFAPLAFFPPLMQSVAYALPFHHVIHTPIQIYMGQLSGQDLRAALAAQAAWALGLLALSRMIFYRVMSGLSIQGG
jgi:ABC-2 type transport system permease protein